jgi:hypothetical protein
MYEHGYMYPRTPIHGVRPIWRSGRAKASIPDICAAQRRGIGRYAIVTDAVMTFLWLDYRLFGTKF